MASAGAGALDRAKAIAASMSSGGGGGVTIQDTEFAADELSRPNAQVGIPRLDDHSIRLSRLSTEDPIFSRTAVDARTALKAHPATKVTTLSNGVRVATERVAGQSTATVAVNVDVGSRFEAESNNGVAHFLEHMFFKGTTSRPQAQLESETELLGYQLNAFTSRETTVFSATVDKAGVPWGLETLSDLILNPRFDDAAVERERGTILREMEEVDGMIEEVVFDRLHETAYRGTALARTILGPVENIKSISAADIRAFVNTHYVAKNMVITVVGDVDHDAVHAEAEKRFAAVAREPQGAARAPGGRDDAVFTGSDIRVRYDSMPEAHIAYAFPTEGFNSPEVPALMVMQSMLGHWDGSPGGEHSSTPLVSYAAQRNAATLLRPFHTMYSDTGLFGVYCVAPPTAVQELMGMVASQITGLAHNPTERLVEEARNQTIVNMLAELTDNNGVACEEIGRHLLSYGRRIHPLELADRVSRVTVADVRNVARRRFYDRDFAMAAVGGVYELPDYNWLRRRTYFQRY